MNLSTKSDSKPNSTTFMNVVAGEKKRNSENVYISNIDLITNRNSILLFNLIKFILFLFLFYRNSFVFVR